MVYSFKGQGVQHAYDAPGFSVYRQRVDVPKFALGEFLEDSNGVPVVLSAGFAAIDKLKVFQIEAGTLVRCAGIKLITPEGSAAVTTGGDNSSSDGWLASFDLNGAADSLAITIVGGGYGADNVMGKVYVADEFLQLEFGTGGQVNAVYDVFIEALKVF